MGLSSNLEVGQKKLEEEALGLAGFTGEGLASADLGPILGVLRLEEAALVTEVRDAYWL